MLPERRRQVIGLALLVVVLAAGWSFWRSTAVPSGARAGAVRRPAPGTGAQPEALPPAEEVRLASLELQRGEPSAASRNPFKFERRAAAGATAAEPGAPAASAPADPAVPLVPSGPPPPPPIPLKFIGVLEQGEGMKWAVLSVGDGRGPLHGKEGDIIDGRYRILKIGTESIDMAYLDGRGRQTIRLTGQ
jgi:hypothetical protein